MPDNVYKPAFCEDYDSDDEYSKNRARPPSKSSAGRAVKVSLHATAEYQDDHNRLPTPLCPNQPPPPPPPPRGRHPNSMSSTFSSDSGYSSMSGGSQILPQSYINAMPFQSWPQTMRCMDPNCRNPSCFGMGIPPQPPVPPPLPWPSHPQTPPAFPSGPYLAGFPSRGADMPMSHNYRGVAPGPVYPPQMYDLPTATQYPLIQSRTQLNNPFFTRANPSYGFSPIYSDYSNVPRHLPHEEERREDLRYHRPVHVARHKPYRSFKQRKSTSQMDYPDRSRSTPSHNQRQIDYRSNDTRGGQVDSSLEDFDWESGSDSDSDTPPKYTERLDLDTRSDSGYGTRSNSKRSSLNSSAQSASFRSSESDTLDEMFPEVGTETNRKGVTISMGAIAEEDEDELGGSDASVAAGVIVNNPDNMGQSHFNEMPGAGQSDEMLTEPDLPDLNSKSSLDNLDSQNDSQAQSLMKPLPATQLSGAENSLNIIQAVRELNTCSAFHSDHSLSLNDDTSAGEAEFTHECNAHSRNDNPVESTASSDGRPSHEINTGPLSDGNVAALAGSDTAVREKASTTQQSISESAVWFATEIANSLKDTQFSVSGYNEYADSEITYLIRDYARLLNNLATTDVEKMACALVRSCASRIAYQLKQEPVSLTKESDVPTFKEKVDLLWRPDSQATPLYVEIPSKDQPVVSGKRRHSSMAVMEEARTFLVESNEFNWLIRRLKIAANFRATGSTYGDVRSKLINVAKGRDRIYTETEWAPRDFLQEQFENADIVPLADVICIAGTVVNAQATTCGEYVAQLWPGVGEAVLDCISTALRNSSRKHEVRLDGGYLTVDVRGHRTSFDVATAPCTLLEVMEVITFLGAACRASPDTERPALCTPSVTEDLASGCCRLEYTSSPTERDISQHNGSCWHKLFRNPAIVEGYPIQTRQPGEIGLEMSLQMMTVLGQTPLATAFAGTTILKGFRSLFAPMVCVGTSIVWHFLFKELQHIEVERTPTKCDESRLSYHEGAQIASEGYLFNHSELESARHFVGWTPAADFLVGSKHATYNIGSSESDASSPNFATLSSINISVTKIIGVGATFVRGKKDTPTSLSSNRVYEEQIYAASAWNVIFYDTHSKRGWLVDGASALVHLTRAWLCLYNRRHAFIAEANEDDDAEVKPHSLEQLWEPTQLDGRDFALKTLFNNTNRQIRLYAEEETKTEVIRDSDTGGLRSLDKTTRTWWCWRHLVQEKWHALEQVHDHLVRQRLSPETNVRLPRLPSGKQSIEGFEFNDLVSGNSPLQPRVTKLEPTAGDWLELAAAADAIMVFGSDFGELISPAKSSGRRSQCGQRAFCPTDQDYLAAPLSILAEVRRRYSRQRDEHVQLGDSLCWKEALLPLENCNCSQGTCKVNVARLHTGSISRRQSTPHVSDDVFQRYPRGAVIFGHEKNKSTGRTRPEVTAPTEQRQPSRKKDRVSDSGIDMGESSSPDQPCSQTEPNQTSQSAVSTRPDNSRVSSRSSRSGSWGFWGRASQKSRPSTSARPPNNSKPSDSSRTSGHTRQSSGSEASRSKPERKSNSEALRSPQSAPESGLSADSQHSPTNLALEDDVPSPELGGSHISRHSSNNHRHREPRRSARKDDGSVRVSSHRRPDRSRAKHGERA